MTNPRMSQARLDQSVTNRMAELAAARTAAAERKSKAQALSLGQASVVSRMSPECHAVYSEAVRCGASHDDAMDACYEGQSPWAPLTPPCVHLPLI